MVKVGDKVAVYAEYAQIFGDEMEVVSLGKAEYLEFIGEHIIVKDKDGKSQIIKSGYYKELPQTEEHIGIGDLIIPKSRTKGTKKGFYVVVDKHQNGISFFDDLGNKVSLQTSKVKKADPNEALKYIADLQQQVHLLQNLFVETLQSLGKSITASLQDTDK